MPTESREIAFKETEFFNAVRDYRLRRGEPLPAGSVLGIDIDDAPDLTATFRISNDDGDLVEKIAITTESIAAALILFCINKKIPLPAHAEKSIKVSGDDIVLHINITMENYNARKSSPNVPSLPFARGSGLPDRRNLN